METDRRKAATSTTPSVPESPPLSPEEVGRYYDGLAQFFHGIRTNQGKLFNDHIEKPALQGLLSCVPRGTRALDIGCGTGIYTKVLAELGFEVTGLDVSAGMLSIARKHCANTSARFLHTSFESVDLSGATFDLILGSFILGYFSDLTSAVQKMASLVANQGAIVLTAVHPLRMASRGHTATAYLVEDYFLPGYYEAVIVKGKPSIRQRKRTLGEITEAVHQAGLVIDRLLEPTPVGSPHDHPGAEFYWRCPSVLILRLRRTTDG
jgi:ubiquinone/menaquinone biosynthesis C-methylase UbiE